MNHIYEIKSTRYDILIQRLEVLNKKAKKLGCNPIKINLLGQSEKKGFIRVEVSGETPKYRDWEFISVIDYFKTDNGDIKTIMNTVAGKQLPEKYRDKPQYCDHCQTNRYRNKTYIVKHINGEYKQVGSSCLKDFLGHENPHKLARRAELICGIDNLFVCLEDEAGYGGGGRYTFTWDLEEHLSMVNAVIRVYGWKSKSSCESICDVPTGEICLNIINDKDFRQQAIKDGYETTEADKKIAKEAIEWATSLNDKENSSDYEHNIAVISILGYCDNSTWGYATSIIPAYNRHLRQQERLNAPKIKSDFVGEIGNRTILNLKLNKIVPIDGHYGITNIHIFNDQSGNQLVWFASGGVRLDNAEGFKENNFNQIKATIKKHNVRHDLYRNQEVKQTILSRVAIINS